MFTVKTADNSLTDIAEAFVKTAESVLTPIVEGYVKTGENVLAPVYANGIDPPSDLRIEWEDVGEDEITIRAVATPNSNGDDIEYEFTSTYINGETLHETVESWGGFAECSCYRWDGGEGLTDVVVSAYSVRDGKYSKPISEGISFI
jgi:hypothetical protein